MTYELILRPAAEEDIAAAALWYEDQAAGLGTEFLEAVEWSLTLLRCDERGLHDMAPL